MTRKWFMALMGLLWAAPLVPVYRYWRFWDQLPLRMASHFDAAGHVNGWMSRKSSLYFTMFFMTFMAAVFSIVLYVSVRKYPPAKLSWALLAFFHVEMWTIVYMMNAVVNFNLDGGPISIAPVLIVTPVGVVALIAVGLTEGRGKAMTSHAAGDLVAEEVHTGRGWSMLLLAPVIGIAISMVWLPTGARLVLAFVGVVLFFAFATAWDGFRYYFTLHGVEIRMLGFRLRSIPLLQIKSYEIDRWSPVGGYGIRGMGNMRAYVWGNKVVHIHTTNGEIYLGHSDPEKIVRDLDQVVGGVSRV